MHQQRRPAGGRVHGAGRPRGALGAHILSFRPLPGELARAGATPAFSFLAPNLCNDGHDAPCADGAPGGLAQADRFLARWGAAHPGRAGLPGRRTDRDHLRQGHGLAGFCDVEQRLCLSLALWNGRDPILKTSHELGCQAAGFISLR
jgi:hypothetical protein